jgi:hypothetical protein
MIAHYRERLKDVQRRPEMWLVEPRFASHVAFTVGMDEGSGRNLLLGFREFLLTKLGRNCNLAWPNLVLTLVEPIGPKSVSLNDLTDDLDAAAVQTWYALLDEFLETREARDGSLKIYRDYLGMMEQTARLEPLTAGPSTGQ